jgi:molecular chaperone GrpE
MEPDMTDTSARRSDEAAAGAEEAPARADDLTALQELLATGSRENAELKDKLLRTLAEMENLRRRTEREVSDARLYGIASFARDILGIADNMHRALDAAGQELRGNTDPSVKTLLEGLELNDRELLKVLEKNGVKRFDPQGQKFDPNLHQAMYEVPDASVPAGSVVQVIQPGYMIGERMLRPALVAVAKGGAKAPADAPQDAD